MGEDSKQILTELQSIREEVKAATPPASVWDAMAKRLEAQQARDPNDSLLNLEADELEARKIRANEAAAAAGEKLASLIPPPEKIDKLVQLADRVLPAKPVLDRLWIAAVAILSAVAAILSSRFVPPQQPQVVIERVFEIHATDAGADQ